MIYALIILLVIDWKQTLVIARCPNRWFERNLFIGQHPSVARVHVWFSLCTLGAAALTFWLQDLYPEVIMVFLATAIIAELLCVVNNYRLGIRL